MGASSNKSAGARASLNFSLVRSRIRVHSVRQRRAAQSARTGAAGWAAAARRGARTGAATGQRSAIGRSARTGAGAGQRSAIGPHRRRGRSAQRGEAPALARRGARTGAAAGQRSAIGPHRRRGVGGSSAAARRGPNMLRPSTAAPLDGDALHLPRQRSRAGPAHSLAWPQSRAGREHDQPSVTSRPSAPTWPVRSTRPSGSRPPFDCAGQSIIR